MIYDDVETKVETGRLNASAEDAWLDSIAYMLKWTNYFFTRKGKMQKEPV